MMDEKGWGWVGWGGFVKGWSGRRGRGPVESAGGGGFSRRRGKGVVDGKGTCGRRGYGR